MALGILLYKLKLYFFGFPKVISTHNFICYFDDYDNDTSSIYRIDTATVVSGYLRVDDEGDKVYFLPVDSNEESLLYDFSLDVGDEFVCYGKFGDLYNENGLTMNLDNDIDAKRLVSSIDTVEIGGYKLRRVNLQCTTGACRRYGSYIEGIGSKLGIPRYGKSFSYTPYETKLISIKLAGVEYMEEDLGI